MNSWMHTYWRIAMDPEKKPYEKPRIESEKVFEHTALSCGSVMPTDAKDAGLHSGGDCNDHTIS